MLAGRHDRRRRRSCCCCCCLVLRWHGCSLLLFTSPRTCSDRDLGRLTGRQPFLASHAPCCSSSSRRRHQVTAALFCNRCSCHDGRGCRRGNRGCRSRHSCRNLQVARSSERERHRQPGCDVIPHTHVHSRGCCHGGRECPHWRHCSLHAWAYCGCPCSGRSDRCSSCSRGGWSRGRLRSRCCCGCGCSGRSRGCASQRACRLLLHLQLAQLAGQRICWRFRCGQHHHSSGGGRLRCCRHYSRGLQLRLRYSCLQHHARRRRPARLPHTTRHSCCCGCGSRWP
mmetsp:Transcript_8846/g.23843  ORF Transcript_8846/g.23843 Transcript_8846/m.23843 type:complete len:283 (+) Transcript_8846:119-967(+)